jgi:hypothetical protein
VGWASGGRHQQRQRQRHAQHSTPQVGQLRPALSIHHRQINLEKEEEHEVYSGEGKGGRGGGRKIQIDEQSSRQMVSRGGPFVWHKPQAWSLPLGPPIAKDRYLHPKAYTVLKCRPQETHDYYLYPQRQPVSQNKPPRNPSAAHSTQQRIAVPSAQGVAASQCSQTRITRRLFEDFDKLRQRRPFLRLKSQDVGIPLDVVDDESDSAPKYRK